MDPCKRVRASEQDKRIEGVRQEMDVAVWLGDVTRAQADSFATQIERRIAEVP